MKRLAGVLIGAVVMTMTLAGTALAQYVAPPAPVNDVKDTGGTAFTGGDVSMPLLIAAVLVVVGLTALFVARRRAASAA